jgi:hypothetical protein
MRRLLAVVDAGELDADTQRGQTASPTDRGAVNAWEMKAGRSDIYGSD